MRRILLLSFLIAGILVAQTSLSRVGQTQIPLGGKDIWVASVSGTDYGFINAGDDGVRKVNLATYSVAASFTSAPVRDIWLRDSMVYVATWTDTFYILRQSNLTVKGKLYLGSANRRASAVSVMDRTSPTGQLWAYLGVYDISNSHAYVFVCDVHDPASPYFVSHVTASTDLGEGYVYDIYVLYGGDEGIASDCGSYTNIVYDGWPYMFLLFREGSAPPFTYKLSLRTPLGSCQSYSYRNYIAHTGNPAGVVEDEYTFPDMPYSLWLAGHDGTMYAYVADGTNGLYVFPVYPDTATSATDDIRDPVISGWTHNTGDDYRDVYVFGDLGFLANYTDGTTGGGKMLYVLDISNIELGDIDTTASVDGYFATGIWGDSLKVHVVADSLR